MVVTDSDGTSKKEKIDYKVKDKDVVRMIQFAKEVELKKIDKK